MLDKLSAQWYNAKCFRKTVASNRQKAVAVFLRMAQIRRIYAFVAQVDRATAF